jgi:hypothetical protein
MPMMWENKQRIQHIPHRPPNGSIPAEKIDEWKRKKSSSIPEIIMSSSARTTKDACPAFHYVAGRTLVKSR